MSDLTWFIENISDSEQTEGLIGAVKKQNFSVVVNRNCFSWSGNDFYTEISNDSNVISSTSIMTARQISHLAWYPGTFCNFSHYSCSQFYPLFHGKLLNESYIMLPYGSLKTSKDRIYKEFWGTHGLFFGVFMRPDSGFKTFDGQMVRYDDFDKFVENMYYGQMTPEKMIVIAMGKGIQREWRLFASKDGIITGSQYKKDEELNVDKDVPKEVVDFGEELLKVGYWPDRVISIDIAENNGKLKLLEIGAFSTSGIYDSDVDKLVEVVSKEAISEFEDSYA